MKILLLLVAGTLAGCTGTSVEPFGHGQDGGPEDDASDGGTVYSSVLPTCETAFSSSNETHCEANEIFPMCNCAVGTHCVDMSSPMTTSFITSCQGNDVDASFSTLVLCMTVVGPKDAIDCGITCTNGCYYSLLTKTLFCEGTPGSYFVPLCPNGDCSEGCPNL